MSSSATTDTPSTASTTSRAPSFPLSTSTDARSVPSLNLTTVQVVNTEPVELDSTPVSPVDARKPSAKKGFSPDFVDEAIDEFGGGNGIGVKEREKREALLSERIRDPAVLVNIPQTPGPGELEVADRAAADAHADTNEASA